MYYQWHRRIPARLALVAGLELRDGSGSGELEEIVLGTQWPGGFRQWGCPALALSGMRLVASVVGRSVLRMRLEP